MSAGEHQASTKHSSRRGGKTGALSGLGGLVERRPQAAFGGFLALHFAVWTALPALLYANLPLDLIEALTYGREWQLGYDKLPPLPWWLVEIAHRLFGTDARLLRAGANLRGDRLCAGLRHRAPARRRRSARSPPSSSSTACTTSNTRR